jgi:hypothetical protein
MHMSWVHYTCGRLKADYVIQMKSFTTTSHGLTIATKVQEINIEKAAQKVLDARALFPSSSLAELYDPLSMPPEL